MPYQVTKTSIDGVLVLEPKVFGDDRGFFFESFNARDFQMATGLEKIFVQDNHSKSTRGVLRGLHFQTEHPQGKLVRVVEGAVFDVVLDIRKNSSTYSKWFGTKLTAENKNQVWIPEGLAHGFLVLSEAAEVLYKTTDYYYPEYEKSLLWCDPALSIEWPLSELGIQPKLSAKDLAGLPLKDLV